MADYPAFPQLIGSQQGWADDQVNDVAVNGRPMARAFFDGKKRVFKIMHLLDNTDIATLESFYDTNRLLDFVFRWKCDGPQYNVMFDGAPKVDWGNPYHRVEVNMRKVD
jgi:hypothetical protein